MCGFAGILTSRSNLDLQPRLLRMQQALLHRGPDDRGLEEVQLHGDYRLGLVHTRLAILDTSAAGHQPMSDPVTGSWIAYNGEVYNHQQIRQSLPSREYSSTSDTETVLHGWGQQGDRILHQLRGMFAFALYDGRRDQFWLVRDRLGIKPLYVSQVDPKTWVFASELRSLLASGLVDRRLNSEAIDSYLAFGAFTAPWTPIANVQSLMPAETWQFDLAGSAAKNSRTPLEPKKDRYWKCPFRPESQKRDRSEKTRQQAVEKIQEILPDATSLRMIADVPVGVFLSGGIDSSGVVSALAARGHKLNTFSVVFGEQQFDESQHARRIAKQFDTEHTELLLRPQQVLDEFDQALSAYDAPSIDGLNTYFISQATRQAGIKVALSGLGGDELFAGYSYFRLQHRLDQPLSLFSAKLISPLLRKFSRNSAKADKLDALLRCGGSRLQRYAICRQVVLPERRRMLMNGSSSSDFAPLPTTLAKELVAATEETSTVDAHSLFELSLYMSNMLLRDLDQMSMAHALEVREPLLDHRLVEAAASIPGWCKLASGRVSPTKGLFCDALPTPLPRDVMCRRKMGFTFPWNQWFRNELKGQIDSILTDNSAIEACGLKPDGVRNLWNGFLTSEPGYRFSDVSSVLHLVHWTKQNQLEVAA